MKIRFTRLLQSILPNKCKRSGLGPGLLSFVKVLEIELLNLRLKV